VRRRAVFLRRGNWGTSQALKATNMINKAAMAVLLGGLTIATVSGALAQSTAPVAPPAQSGAAMPGMPMGGQGGMMGSQGGMQGMNDPMTQQMSAMMGQMTKMMENCNKMMEAKL